MRREKSRYQRQMDSRDVGKYPVEFRLDIRGDRRDGVASVDVIGSIRGGLQGGCAVAFRVALF